MIRWCEFACRLLPRLVRSSATADTTKLERPRAGGSARFISRAQLLVERNWSYVRQKNPKRNLIYSGGPLGL
jgi:hypothetical protein